MTVFAWEPLAISGTCQSCLMHPVLNKPPHYCTFLTCRSKHFGCLCRSRRQQFVQCSAAGLPHLLQGGRRDLLCCQWRATPCTDSAGQPAPRHHCYYHHHKFILVAYAGLEDSSLSNALQQGCPSYFKEDDKIYYAANGELRRAQTLQGSQRQDVTRAALEKLIRVSLSYPADTACST